MSPDHPLAPLIREYCPKRYPVGWPKKEATLALDPIEIYELACQVGARLGIRHGDSLADFGKLVGPASAGGRAP